MPYTIEQVSLETAEYKLTDQELSKLTNSLNTAGIEQLILQDQLHVNDFICQKADKKNFVLSEDEAKQIVNAYTYLKDTEIFKANKLKLKSLLFWITTAEIPYLQVVHVDTIKKLNDLYLPSLAALPNQYNEAISKNPEFKDIERKLDELIAVRAHNARRSLVLGLIEQYGVEKINNYLQFLEKSPILLFSKNQHDAAIGKYLRLCGLELRNQAAKFFTDILQKQNKTPHHFTYSFKKTGVQYGIILKIDYHTNDHQEQSIKYFIKSHQSGHTFSSSDRRLAFSSKEPIDLKELFVYKTFEYLKLGPKTHFFIINDPDIGGLYIGTQDLSFSKKHPPNTKLFKTYDQYKSLQQVPESKPTEETKKGVLNLDAFARIFHLVDLNQGNFGRITIEEKQEVVKESWKLVDFRTPQYGSYQYQKMDMVNGFLAGNGTQSYEKSFQEILLSGSEIERLQTLTNVLSQYKSDFQNHIEAAYYHVLEITQSNPDKITESGDIAVLVEDLKKYKDAVSSNFIQFLEEANNKLQELSSISQPKIQ